MFKKLLPLAICTAVAVVAIAADDKPMDFGMKVQHLLNAQSEKLFGFNQPLQTSYDGHVAREPGQHADDLILLAEGLEATILTREAADKADMFAFWPNDEAPTHAIFCIEGGRQNLGTTLPSGIAKYNPSVQRIDLVTGAAETILRGMDRCDGIRTTAWGTVLATEEAGDGQGYEVIDPLSTDNHTVLDRATGVIVDENNNPSTQIAKRDALPTMAWEGLTVTAEGVVIGGDELRPGTGTADKDGGAIFKFVPAVPHPGGEIADLALSPFAAGSVYAMQVSCVNNKQQAGQGCEVGNAAWLAVSATNARDDADATGATGYYRPEDLHMDPTYEGEGVRFCWTNTGNEGAKNYGEVMCGVDSDPLLADDHTRSVVVNRFVEGDEDFNSVDNLAFQPLTGNLYVIEDHRNGDIFGCLPDGGDRDIKTDGCVKVLTVKDQSAEPTGFGFFGDGQSALLSVQHSGDDDALDVDDYGTDDILLITGFKVK
ncbi:alkaline phosphatase PhoX [Porticoccus sp.]